MVGDEDEIREIFYDRVDDRIEDLKEYNPDYILDFLTLDEDNAEQFAEDEAMHTDMKNEEPEEVIAYLNQRR